MHTAVIPYCTVVPCSCRTPSLMSSCLPSPTFFSWKHCTLNIDCIGASPLSDENARWLVASWGMSSSSGNLARTQALHSQTSEWLLRWSTGAQDESLIRSNSVATALQKAVAHVCQGCREPLKSALKGTNALWNGERGLSQRLPLVPLEEK